MIRKAIILCLCVVLFIFSGCDAYQYPKAEYTEDGNLIYDSQLYIKRDITLDGYHLDVLGDSYPVLRTPGIFSDVTLQIQAKDKEKNIIFRRYYEPQYYLKETFSLPDKAFQCDISSVYIWSKSENQKKVHICKLSYPISNIAESEGLRLELGNSMKISCKVEFVKYKH